eukprot:12288785-Alexandrium_andersonii.AAC.1
MSASLVGSEMCIRDRFGCGPKAPEQRPKSARICQRSTAQNCMILRCAVPVSYTHLTLPTICSV